MKLVIEIPDNIYRNCCSIPLNSVERAVKNGKSLNSVLDEIKAKIEEESYLSYDDNPRRILDESCVLHTIDKYKNEVSE